MVTARSIALVYVLFATLAVLLLATTMPPMQNADEAAHAFRADQISRLHLAGKMLPDGEFGGNVSSGLADLQRETSALPFHTARKVTRAMYAPLSWGEAVPTGFPNTALNPPFFYLPAAAMAAITRQMGVGLPHALVLMRLATGFATVSIAAIAIAVAGDAAIWLFTVLLLPMSEALSAAVSQDGPLLACTALAAALFLYIRRVQASRQIFAFVAMCLLLAAIGMARAPYLCFAVLPLAAPVTRSLRVAGAMFIFICVVAWVVVSAAHVPLPLRPDGVVSPVGQVIAVLTHPWRLGLIAVRTWLANDEMIARSFIGLLGWLDVDLPTFYRRLAWAGLALAACAAVCRGRHIVSSRVLATELAAIFGAIGAVALIQYMAWTVVGGPVIEGIQGRYFLPPALMMAVFLGGSARSNTRLASSLCIPVLVFPIISIAVVMHALIIRYYI
jgi:uncharacterized membrane protein